MAATEDPRDNLRFSFELPQIQQQMDSGLMNLGSLGQLKQRLMTLLEITLERGEQEERVNTIIAALQQLEQLEALAVQASADNNFLETTPDGIRADQPAADFDDGFSPQELAFFAPTPNRLDQETTPPKTVQPIPEEAGPLDCPICFTDGIPVDEQRALATCSHRYCIDCFRHHFTSLIDEGKVGNEDLHCPQPGCNASPELYELQALLTRETFDKYLQFMVLNDLKNDSNARWCINKQCGQPIIWDPDTPHVECPACHTHFCFLCKQPWHEGKPCAVVLTKEDEQFVKYVKAQGRATKPCPNCGTAIEKNEGCNHMTCPNCRHQWCWLCLGAYSGTHYSSGPCSGLQFTQSDSLWAAKAKNVGKYVAIGAGAVVAAPLVIAGGAVVLAGGLIALPFWGIAKGIKSLSD